ncbi:CBS domain-containing protein [Rubrobacter tropicus]|uniref:CBS domain-containing protein n=1 Tax=Rubrobacter tropicus TaxID=2653851 RepID=A0A6G8QDE8_9ACTN|nr:CBS domain-containing protein [Rubrobacter tropicus]QIN84462.1 CBS domain-containing protein [Rubrobacter tropicus]
MNVKVADLMAEDVVAVQRHNTVEHARELMRRHRIHALPVADPDGTAAGIVSSKDLAANLKGATPISRVMTSEVHTIPPYNDVHHAARLMRNRRVHHVVVTHEKEIVGMLSSLDLLKLVEQHRFEMKPGPTPSAKGARRR